MTKSDSDVSFTRPRIVAMTDSTLAHCRSARQATRASQISRGTLRGWIKKSNLKLHFPLIPDKAN